MIRAEALRMLPWIDHLVANEYANEFMVRLVPDAVHINVAMRPGTAILFRLIKDQDLMTGRAHFYGKQAYGILVTETRSFVRDVSHERIFYAILCTRDGRQLPELSDELYALDGEPIRLMVTMDTYQQVKRTGVIERVQIASDVRAAVQSQLPGPISTTDAASIARRFSPVYDVCNDYILHAPLPMQLFMADDDKQLYSSDLSQFTSTAIHVLVLAMGCRTINRRKTYWLQVRPTARKIITPPTFFHNGFAVSESCYKLARNNQVPTNNKPLVQLPPRPVSKIHREHKFRLGPADQVLVNHRFSLQNGDIRLHVLEIKDYSANIVKAIRLE